MKKTYISPALNADMMEEDQMLMASFVNELNDEDTINAGDMLGRGNYDLWDDDEEY